MSRMTKTRLEDVRQNYSSDVYSAFHLSLTVRECVVEIEALLLDLAASRDAHAETTRRCDQLEADLAEKEKYLVDAERSRDKAENERTAAFSRWQAIALELAAAKRLGRSSEPPAPISAGG